MNEYLILCEHTHLSLHFFPTCNTWLEFLTAVHWLFAYFWLSVRLWCLACLDLDSTLCSNSKKKTYHLALFALLLIGTEGHTLQGTMSHVTRMLRSWCNSLEEQFLSVNRSCERLKVHANSSLLYAGLRLAYTFSWHSYFVNFESHGL